jgi:cytochrome c oxidase subunit IV
MSAPIEHEHHVVGPKTYLTILVILLVMTAITTGAAFINMGVFSPIVALAIACFKAVLVILFFMHIRYSSKVMMLTVGAGFFTFLVLITMTLSDYISRNWGLWERSLHSATTDFDLSPAGTPELSPGRHPH